MVLVFVMKWVKSVLKCALYIFHVSASNALQLNIIYLGCTVSAISTYIAYVFMKKIFNYLMQ